MISHATPLRHQPEGMSSIKNFKMLDIGKTHTKTLPKDVGKLTNLQWLSLAGADIKNLPVCHLHDKNKIPTFAHAKIE